jgi:hypothetical protein
LLAKQPFRDGTTYVVLAPNCKHRESFVPKRRTGEEQPGKALEHIRTQDKANAAEPRAPPARKPNHKLTPIARADETARFHKPVVPRKIPAGKLRIHSYTLRA